MIEGGRTGFEYDEKGRRVRVIYPNGTQTTYTYGQNDRITEIITTGTTGEIIDYHRYTYDDKGNIISHESPGIERNYSYDSVERLTEAEYEFSRRGRVKIKRGLRIIGKIKLRAVLKIFVSGSPPFRILS